MQETAGKRGDRLQEQERGNQDGRTAGQAAPGSPQQVLPNPSQIQIPGCVALFPFLLMRNHFGGWGGEVIQGGSWEFCAVSVPDVGETGRQILAQTRDHTQDEEPLVAAAAGDWTSVLSGL